MAAKSVRVTLYSFPTSVAVLVIEPPWWNADLLCADARFTMSNETGSYYDWDADLNEEEFKEMHEKFRRDAQRYASPGWQERIAPMMQALDGALEGALGPISKANVCVFEWESGL